MWITWVMPPCIRFHEKKRSKNPVAIFFASFFFVGSYFFCCSLTLTSPEQHTQRKKTTPPPKKIFPSSSSSRGCRLGTLRMPFFSCPLSPPLRPVLRAGVSYGEWGKTNRNLHAPALKPSLPLPPPPSLSLPPPQHSSPLFPPLLPPYSRHHRPLRGKNKKKRQPNFLLLCKNKYPTRVPPATPARVSGQCPPPPHTRRRFFPPPSPSPSFSLLLIRFLPVLVCSHTRTQTPSVSIGLF